MVGRSRMRRLAMGASAYSAFKRQRRARRTIKSYLWRSRMNKRFASRKISLAKARYNRHLFKYGYGRSF